MTPFLWKLVSYGVMAGVAVILLVAEAVHDRANARRLLPAIVAGWLLPGAGHAWLGRTGKGLALFALIGGLFAAGAALTGGRMVTFDENPFYYIGQAGSGLTLGVQNWLADRAGPPRNVPDLVLVDPGLLYMSVAGLLNLLVVMNVFDIPQAPAGRGPETPAPPPGAAAPAAPVPPTPVTGQGGPA